MFSRSPSQPDRPQEALVESRSIASGVHVRQWRVTAHRRHGDPPACACVPPLLRPAHPSTVPPRPPADQCLRRSSGLIRTDAEVAVLVARRAIWPTVPSNGRCAAGLVATRWGSRRRLPCRHRPSARRTRRCSTGSASAGSTTRSTSTGGVTPPDHRARRGVDARTFTKVVGVATDDGRRALLIVDAPDRVDLRKARAILDAGEVRLLSGA